MTLEKARILLKDTGVQYSDKELVSIISKMQLFARLTLDTIMERREKSNQHETSSCPHTSFEYKTSC